MKVLIVDDDATFAETLAQAMRRRGIATIVAHDADGALAQAARCETLDAAVLDLRLSSESGLRLIEPLRAAHPGMRILLLTGYASIATAVEAIKLGAVHYLPKPAQLDEILQALARSAWDPHIPAPTEPMSVERLEWEYINKVLTEHGGNLSATARALKMHRRTLQRKLAKRPVKA
ncbi:MAG: response regulator transcription factor [Thiobacillaceae bacterium]